MSGGLLVVLLVLVPVVPLALPANLARAGGVGDGALRLTVTVNGRGDSRQRPPAVRAGTDAVKRYRLVNRGEAHLYGVRVVDPEVPAGSVRCPAGPLPALGEVECVAGFRAAPGLHRGTVHAEGTVPSLRKRLTATAGAGYTGIAGSLGLTERVTVGGGSTAGRSVGSGSGRGVGSGSGLAVGRGTATVTYTVTNHGNRPLQAVRVRDTALGLRDGSVDCAGHPGTVPRLAPGASAHCTATVRRPPGTHRSTGVASGSDRVTTYGPGGARVAAPMLVARSSAVFTVVGPGGSVGGSGGVSSGGTVGGTAPGAVGGSLWGPVGDSVRGAGAAPGVLGAPVPGAGAAPGAAAAVPGAAAAAVPGAPAAAEAGPGAAAAAAAAAAAGAALPGAAAPGAGAPGAAAPGAALPGAGAPGAAAPGGAGVPPGALAAAGLPPAGVLPGAVPPAAVPPLLPIGPPGSGDGTGTDPGSGVGVTAGTGVGGVVSPPAARRAAALDSEGFLGRLRRRGREAGEFGVVTMLLLLLIPAAVAAALLGNRRS
ncbi:hypothetical protein [Streptomyces sp. NPDC058671]|uniref:DUF7507 domain-containing protein n=1 Tax=Streptomyces sp. NPDC058671 TaxID=3346590 RepID=UPI00365EA79E